MVVRQYSSQNKVAEFRFGRNLLECHGKLMPFHIHLSRADPSEA